MLFLPWVASTQAVRNDLSRSLLTCILILYRVIWYLSYTDILVYTWWIAILYIFMLNKFCLSPESCLYPCVNEVFWVCFCPHLHALRVEVFVWCALVLLLLKIRGRRYLHNSVTLLHAERCHVSASFWRCVVMLYVTLLANKNLELDPERLIIGTRFNIKMPSYQYRDYRYWRNPRP